MNKKNFNLLLESMREGGEIPRGERKLSRQFVVENKEDVQQLFTDAVSEEYPEMVMT